MQIRMNPRRTSWQKANTCITVSSPSLQNHWSVSSCAPKHTEQAASSLHIGVASNRGTPQCVLPLGFPLNPSPARHAQKPTRPYGGWKTSCMTFETNPCHLVNYACPALRIETCAQVGQIGLGHAKVMPLLTYNHFCLLQHNVKQGIRGGNRSHRHVEHLAEHQRYSCKRFITQVQAEDVRNSARQ